VKLNQTLNTKLSKLEHPHPMSIPKTGENIGGHGLFDVTDLQHACLNAIRVVIYASRLGS